jgi:spermidine/putrescine transport system substrate-binding protein
LRRRTLFFLGLSGLAGCSGRRALRLNVFNWSNYISRDTLPRFEAETGIHVRYAIYESNEEMLARVLSGNSGWDVVFPTHNVVAPMLEQKLLAELHHEALPNLANLAAAFQAPSWDPKLAWSVPYMWGSSGILYRGDLRPKPERWADLWNARLSGRITMLDDPIEVLGAALKKLGLSLNSTNADELGRAKDEALRQKPLLRAYLNAEVRDQAVAGDVVACQLWATVAQQAIDAASVLRFAYPLEGFARYCDTMAILRESRRQDLAHRFLDYLLRPDVAAAICVESRTATANEPARLLLPESVRSLETLYPPASVTERGEWFAPIPAAAQRLRDRIWTEIKSA